MYEKTFRYATNGNLHVNFRENTMRTTQERWNNDDDADLFSRCNTCALCVIESVSHNTAGLTACWLSRHHSSDDELDGHAGVD